MGRLRECIFCGSRADSGEHLFPASLGGRRVHGGILCSACNSGFSPLDDALTRQLAYFADSLGVRPDRYDQPRKARGEDPRLRREYWLDHRGSVEAARVDVWFKRQGAGAILKATGPPDGIAAIRRHLRDLDPDAIPTVGDEPFVPIQVRHRVTYSSRLFRRGAARIALNYLASLDGGLARAPEIGPLKRFILDGSEQPCAWESFEPDRTGVPSLSPFAHRVALLLPAQSGRCFARVTFFGAVAVTVDLGGLTLSGAASHVIDVNPLAERPDDERHVSIDGRPPDPEPFRPFASLELLSRFRLLDRSIKLRRWLANTRDFQRSINATRSIPLAKRRPLIASILKQDRGRLVGPMRLAVEYADLFYAKPLRAPERRRLRRTLAASRWGALGLSTRTYRLSDEVADALAGVLAEKIVYHPCTPIELFNLFEGVLAGAVALGVLARSARIRRRRLAVGEVVRRCRAIDAAAF
jgi:hypothetical protein